MTGALVTVAHGPPQDVVHEVTDRAARALGVPSRVAYVDAAPEDVHDTDAVVPLLLTSAHHLLAALRLPAPRVAPPLGPHPLLAAAQASRLLAAGARPGQRVVLVALGSSDPDVDPHLTRACELLAATWTGPVEAATLTGRGRRPEEVLRGGVAVSPYLLSPGPAQERILALADAAGARTVAEVVGAHRFVTDLVVRRYRVLHQAVAA